MSTAPEKLPLSEAPAEMRPLVDFSDSIEAIAERLRGFGGMGVLRVDASSLEVIERRFGVIAHQQTTEKLGALVQEALSLELHEQDMVMGGAPGADEVLVFFFRPGGDRALAQESLVRCLTTVDAKLSESGQLTVYPYLRGLPFLPMGFARAIHNPGIRPERQVREMLEHARSDAALNAMIEARNRRCEFEDVVFSEDITMLYEPIVSVSTRDTVGYEALARGPFETALHSPDALFEMAEHTQMAFELDCLCRRKALRGAWGLKPGKLLFLNCLPMAINDPAFQGEVLRETLEELRLRPSDVVFEISEKESIQNFEVFREARDYYAGLGFKIALDDTGVGYGSLEAVMELDPDFIKVDLTLIRGIDTDPPKQELLTALNRVANSINASVIAEGIETSEELATVASLGVAYGQGYLFGRPAPLRRTV